MQRIIPEDAQCTYNTSTNNNGSRLIEMMEEYQLLEANSQFRKKRGKLWTSYVTTHDETPT